MGDTPLMSRPNGILEDADPERSTYGKLLRKTAAPDAAWDWEGTKPGSKTPAAVSSAPKPAFAVIMLEKNKVPPGNSSTGMGGLHPRLPVDLLPASFSREFWIVSRSVTLIAHKAKN
jgi:hypothetical protein